MACGKNGGEEMSTIIPKDQMTEEDIKLNFITPALVGRGWQNKITMNKGAVHRRQGEYQG